MLVRTYMGTKYLTPSKTGFTATPIEDIGEVFSEISDIIPYTDKQSVTVGLVEKIVTGRACLSCKGQVEQTSPLLGRCTTCNMRQRLECCSQQVCAHLLVIHDNTQTLLIAHLPIIQAIINDRTIGYDTDPEDIESLLLLSHPFSLSYDHANVIQHVSRT